MARPANFIVQTSTRGLVLTGTRPDARPCPLSAAGGCFGGKPAGSRRTSIQIPAPHADPTSRQAPCRATHPAFKLIRRQPESLRFEASEENRPTVFRAPVLASLHSVRRLPVPTPPRCPRVAGWAGAPPRASSRYGSGLSLSERRASVVSNQLTQPRKHTHPPPAMTIS